MQKLSKPAIWCTLVVLALTSSGCPLLTPPNYLPNFIVTPDILAFGKGVNSLTFTVAKSWTSQTIPDFTITPSQQWISVTPTSGNSSGPTDKVTVTVTINRSLLANGENEGNIVISAPGIAQSTVSVLADSVLAANFVADKTNVPVGDTVQFTDLSVFTTESGPIIGWEWDFGDGSKSNERHPRHTYQNQGLYSVELTVTTATVSNTRRRANYIVVTGQRPTAFFSADDTDISEGGTVQFTDLSTPGTSPITSWLWNFGDGGTSSLTNPSHTYGIISANLTYTFYSVTLTVANSIGPDTHVQSNYIKVNQAGPMPGFAATPTNPAIGQPVQFQNMTESNDPNAKLTYVWDFGDGTTSTLPNPVHTYLPSDGDSTFDVKLSVQSELGSRSAQKNDYIVLNSGAIEGQLNAAKAAVVHRIVETQSFDAYTAYVVQVDAADAADRWIVVIDPINRQDNSAQTFLVSGEEQSEKPEIDSQFVDAALSTGAPVAVVYQLPATSADAEMLYSFQDYLDSVKAPASDDWSALPSTVAGLVSALDAVDSVLADAPVVAYSLTGATQSGWAAWLNAATLDARIVGVLQD